MTTFHTRLVLGTHLYHVTAVVTTPSSSVERVVAADLPYLAAEAVAKELTEQRTAAEAEGYRRGLREGIVRSAFVYDGRQYVGSMCPLERALAEVDGK